MPADIGTIEAALKEQYEPAIQTFVNNETPLLSLFEKVGDRSWAGREVIELTRTNRNRGGYAMAEGGTIATAGAQQLEKFRIPMRYMAWRARLTNQAMAASRSEEGAFVRALTLEMDGLQEDARVLRNFYVNHDGRGVRALMNGDPGTGTTYTVDSPGGVAGATHGNRFLNVGDHVAFVSPDGVLRAGGTREITAIAAGGTTFTAAAANAAVADNDFVVKAYGSDASIAIGNTEWQKAPMGMLGLVDDGGFVNVFHGISRTTYPQTQSTVISGVGALSADALYRIIHVAMQRGNAKINRHVCHHSTLRAYIAITDNDRRYTAERLMNPDAGTKAATGGELSFGNIPITVDQFFPYGTWDVLDTRYLVRYVGKEGSWMDEDGAVLSRVADQTAYEATFELYENFHNDRANTCGRLDGISSLIIVAHVL